MITAQLLFILVASLFIAGTTNFLQFCFRPGNIFSAYLPWLAKSLSADSPELRNRLASCGDNKECRDSTYIDYAFEFTPLFRTFGGCGVCFNIFIAVISSIALALISYLAFPSYALWLFCFVPSISSIFFRFIDIMEQVRDWIDYKLQN